MAKWEDLLKQANEDRAKGKPRRPRRPQDEPRGLLPSFEIREYGLTLDFNRPFRDVLFDFERAYFNTVLNHLNHSMADLARHAGMERTHLYRKIRTLGLDVESMRENARKVPSTPRPSASTLSGNSNMSSSAPSGASSKSAVRIDYRDSIEFPRGSTLDHLQLDDK